MRQVLLIPHIKVHNANAQSSPYTVGFPAMTAWLGAVHALQRKLNQNGFDGVRFKGVGVFCHEIDFKGYKEENFFYSIIGTRNPLKEDGTSPSFIEEARCQLDVSLVIEFEGIKDDQEEMTKAIAQIKNELLSKIKMASGDILSFGNIEFIKIIEERDFKNLKRKIMPSYAIIERRSLMVQAMQNGKDAINALLDHLKIMHRSQKDEDGKITWTSKRKESGWIVPIATGFHGLTEIGKAGNQRDPDTPHRFAESVVTLGEFVMPYRLKSLDEMLWHYHADLENNLYLCQQN
ncbi:MAG: type I-F CRISPR-associated protein Csy2 [Desulfamplus sp.]|nr:type I-F CRISPR-associated protein Csy2 [Desulfamplus sp.]